MRYLALALLLLAAGAPKDASAAVVAIPGWDVTVSDSVTDLGGSYRYQYSIQNTGATDFNFTAFLINEAAPHPAGIHHEYNVTGGAINYDNVPEATKLGLSSHNYDWGVGVVAAGSSVTFGFDDVHGPTLEYWGIDTGTTTFTAAPADRLLVPVPEPGTIMLLGIGALGMFGVKNAKRREAELA
jgi:hypothetical protein